MKEQFASSKIKAKIDKLTCLAQYCESCNIISTKTHLCRDNKNYENIQS